MGFASCTEAACQQPCVLEQDVFVRCGKHPRRVQRPDDNLEGISAADDIHTVLELDWQCIDRTGAVARRQQENPLESFNEGAISMLTVECVV